MVLKFDSQASLESYFDEGNASRLLTWSLNFEDVVQRKAEGHSVGVQGVQVCDFVVSNNELSQKVRALNWWQSGAHLLWRETAFASCWWVGWGNWHYFLVHVGYHAGRVVLNANYFIGKEGLGSCEQLRWVWLQVLVPWDWGARKAFDQILNIRWLLLRLHDFL